MALHKNTRIILLGVLLLLVVFIGSVFKKNNQSFDHVAPSDVYGGEVFPPGGNDFGSDVASIGIAEESLVARESVSKSRVANSSGSSITVPAPIVDDGVPRPGQDTKVIRSGNIDMRVNNAQRATDNITALAQSIGGDVLNSSFSKQSQNITTGYLTVKVPSDKFSEAFAGIKNIGSVVVHSSQNTQDVTEEFIDLEAQLRNKRAQEEKMRGYLDRAEDIDEILKVEQQLTRVRGEVERLEGRLKYLGNKADFAAITVSLSEDTQVLPSDGNWRPVQDAKDALNALAQKSQNLASGMIVFIISRLPFIVLALIVIVIGYRLIKKVLKKFEA